MPRIVYGKHPVEEALRQGRGHVSRLMLDGKNRSGLEHLALLAREAHVQVAWVNKDELERVSHSPHHQGAVAMAPDFGYVSVRDFAARSSDTPRVVVALDSVTDPQNLGACLRAAGAFGADLVIITKDRSAQVTPVVTKAAAGATEVVPLARETNLVQALDVLKKAGFWVFGLDGESPQALGECDLAGNVVLVLGSEGEGMRRLVREACDHVAHLSAHGPIESLNVAQACAVALYEVYRRRVG